MSAIDINNLSEEFKHQFLEMYKPWILQQLGDSMPTPRGQLSKLLNEEAEPWDIGNVYRDDISDDSGSDDDWDMAASRKLQVDPVSRRILVLWLVRTRRRLGLPDTVFKRPDVSSDSEEEELSQRGKGSKVQGVTRQIAIRWLEAAKGRPLYEKIRDDISSDESESDGGDVKAQMAMSAKSREIANIWLSNIRAPKESQATRASDSDSSSEQEDLGRHAIGSAAQRIGKLWLEKLRKGSIGGGGSLFRRVAVSDTTESSSTGGELRRGPVGALARTRTINVSDSGSTSSGSEVEEAQDQVRISVKTKAIAKNWLQQIRRR